MGNERGQRWERERDEESEGCSSVFRPCGLVPPGIAEHSVKILHFKINHSRPSTKRKAHTFTRMCTLAHANKCTFTQHVTGNVFCPCPASTRQPQHVRAVCVIAGCCDSMTRGEHVRSPTYSKKRHCRAVLPVTCSSEM